MILQLYFMAFHTERVALCETKSFGNFCEFFFFLKRLTQISCFELLSPVHLHETKKVFKIVQHIKQIFKCKGKQIFKCWSPLDVLTFSYILPFIFIKCYIFNA